MVEFFGHHFKIAIIKNVSLRNYKYVWNKDIENQMDILEGKNTIT